MSSASVAIELNTEQKDPCRWWALAVIAAATMMVVLDVSIVNIALPQAQSDLRISDANRHWIVTAYALAFGGLLLLGGRVADFIGRKRAFLIGLIGFALASAVGGLAPNAGMLFGARAVQGMFAALLAPAALALIAVTFIEQRERAKAFGVYGMVAGGGGAVGLILGGVLTEYADWRWCLFVNVPIAVAAVLAAIPTVRESRAEGQRHYDVPGAVLVTSGLAALGYAFTEAAREGVGWRNMSTMALLLAGVLLLVTFVVFESRTAHPLLPLHVVLDRNRGGSFLALLFIGAGMFAMLLILTYYLQVNLGYEPLKAGLAFLPFSGGIIITALLTSTLVPRLGPKPVMVVGMAMGTAGLLWLTRLDVTSTYATGVLPSLVVMSVGLGFVLVPMNSTALFGIQPRDAGVASAMVNTTQQVGGALGIALLNTLYASAVAGYLTSDHPGADSARALQLDAYLHGYRIAFLSASGFFIAAFIVITFLMTSTSSRDAYLPSNRIVPETS